MWRKEIEIILARQLASYLAMPIFIVDVDGNLLYFNEPAETILGRRFEETGWMDVHEWSTAFHPTDPNGQPITPEDLPTRRVLRTRQPSHQKLMIYGLDGVSRSIEVTAFPLVGPGDRFLGAVSIFWELNGEQNE
jgi:PAS domain-containing protein